MAMLIVGSIAAFLSLVSFVLKLKYRGVKGISAAEVEKRNKFKVLSQPDHH